MARQLTTFSKLLITALIVGSVTIGGYYIKYQILGGQHTFLINLREGDCTSVKQKKAFTLNSNDYNVSNCSRNICQVCKK